VAAGRLGGFVQHDCLPWDWLPGAGLVIAAGGDIAVVPAAGHRWHIAGSKRVVDELATILSRSG
jgi:fructose-1,6-bisphosphatase/inositol monophosphatase family enzyme